MAYFPILLIFSTILMPSNSLQVARKRQAVRAPMDKGRYDFEFVYNYTRYLHGVYRFNSFVTFSHYESRRRPNFVMVPSFERALIDDFEVPVIVCGRHSPAKLRHLIGLNNMVIVQFNTMNDTILQAVDDNLEGLHFITILFFYKHKNNLPPTAKELHDFFNWCWLRNMINVALTFQIIEVKIYNRPNARTLYSDNADVYVQNQVYTYTPFPKLTIQNLTDDVANGKGEFTTDRITNVNGYIFKTPMFQHAPYVFLDSNNERCNGKKYCAHSLTGVSGHIYKEYISQINGTIEVELVNVSQNLNTVDEVLLAAARKKVDIVPHPFSEVYLSNDYSAGSYPIAQTNLCIIVPLEREMARQHYLPYAFQTCIWYFVLFTFLLLFTMEICFNFKASNIGISGLSAALIAAVNLLLDQANVVGPTQNGCRFYKLFYIILPFMTFVLTNMYAASLTSFLTTTPYGVQIDTVAQLLASDLEIMTTRNQRKLYFETNHLPIELIPKLRIVDSATLERHSRSLNTSFAYVATAEIWSLLNYQQRHLTKPLFRMPDKELCSAKFFIRFPVQWDSPFTLSLAIFFMATQESGFALKWRDLSTYQAKQLNFTKVVQKDVDLWAPLSMQHFITAIYLICSLWAVAIFCLLLELLWFHIVKVSLSRQLMTLKSKRRQLKRQLKYRKFYSRGFKV